MSKQTQKRSKDFPKGKNSKKKFDKDKFNEEIKDKKASCSYENDAMWYALTEQLLEQLNSWSFDDVVGIPTELKTHPWDAATYTNYVNVGAIMQIELFPTIGYQGAPQAPYAYRTAIGDASQRIYSVLSASNGKTTKYLPEDPALVILMLGNITSMSAVYWRLVGIRNLFSPRNRLVPNKIIEAMGFNAVDFLKKISNSMERYNNIVARLNGISMFADIPYFEKCNEIYSHLFFDKGSAMGQYYVTKPAGWFRYTDGEINPTTGFFTGNKLTFTRWEGLLEIDDFLDVLEHQVDDMLKSSLFNYVYSDVIREIRRNGGQVYQFSAISPSYYIMPEFSEVFMTQVHNMSWGLIKSLDSYEITDNVNTLDLEDNLDYDIADPTTDLARLRMGDQIVDFPYTDTPDYKIMAEALIYKTFSDSMITEGQGAGEVMKVAVPDHAVFKVKIMYCTNTGSVYEMDVPYVASRADFATLMISGFDSFDIRPMLLTAGPTDDGKSRLAGCLNFWTTVSTDKVERIFRQSFIKLFSPKFLDENKSITTIAK